MATGTAQPKIVAQHHNRNGHAAKPLADVVDPYVYGWRRVAEIGHDGEIVYHDIPLTQDDFLDPQVGDQLVQSDKHGLAVASMATRFDARYASDDTTGVFSDVKMYWGIPGLKEPAPDLAIIPNLSTKHENHSSFSVVKEGTRPCLIVEVVSPNYPGDDTDKVTIYEKAGIQEYIIIDAHFNDTNAECELIGYRLVNGKYEPIKPDEDGGLLSETTGVYFLMDDTDKTLFLYDTINDEVMHSLTDEQIARRQAEEEKRQVEAEKRQAEAEKRQAQAQSEADTKARRLAEEEVKRLKELLEKGSSSPGSTD